MWRFLIPCLFACVQCTNERTEIPRPVMPEQTPPGSHVPPHPTEWEPSTRDGAPRLSPEIIEKHLPVAPAVPASEPVAVPAPEAPIEKPTEAKVVEVDPVQEQMDLWLESTLDLEPGCLVNNTRPDVDLPSPDVIAKLLREQPGPFAGAAREALVCLLQLPRLTGAEIYGKSAFRGQARSARISMVGGALKQGILVAVITTDQPRGEGTYIGVFDERADQWYVRNGFYLPWTWESRGRQILSLKGIRSTSRRRHTLHLKQKDATRTVEQWIGLTSSEQLQLQLETVTHYTQDNGDKVVGKVHVRGRKWPRTLLQRSIIKPADKESPRRWRLASWEATGETPYVRSSELEGAIDLEGAKTALNAQFPIDADWIVGQLPKRLRRQSATHVFRAQIAAQRKRHKSARRHWRKAIRAKDAPGSVQRDYGYYLMGQKRHRMAKKAFNAYLKANPQADDRQAIETLLKDIGDRP